MSDRSLHRNPWAAFALLLGVAAGGQEPGPGRVEAAATMRAPRAVHTATRLGDGRVLVAGGFVEKGSAQGAELYDPGSGRFLPLPPMATTRHSHTATLLPSGKVLLVGGYGAGNQVLASAELFDPATNSFLPAGSLGAARAGHVAAPLPGGKVLIAGGVGPGWTFLASAEVYDPATGRFSPTGDMTAPRESHAVVRLQDGRVLIVGGHAGPRASLQLYASAEVYDAASGAFRRTGSLRVARHKHDAVLLADGRVLVCGGADLRDNAGQFSSTELFDPRSGTFTDGPPLRLPRYKHQGSSVLLPDGRVLVAGGAAIAEVLDVRAGNSATVPGQTSLAGQFSATAPLPGGAVLITGGYGPDRGPQASAWVFRP